MVAKLGDLLSPDNFKSINDTHEIKVGNVYIINMTRKNGLYISNKSTESKPKYFVVIGSDADGNYYGGVLISSNLPISTSTDAYQCYVKQSDNPYLEYSSYINCTRIFSSTASKINVETYVGCLDAQSTYSVVSLILDENNPYITQAERKKYNIEPYDFPCF